MEEKDLDILDNLIGNITHYACYALTPFGHGIINSFREILPCVPGDQFDKIPEGILYQLSPISLDHERDESTLHLYIKKIRKGSCLMDPMEDISNLVKELGENIGLAVQESERIAEIVAAIKEEGFQVSIFLEANAALTKSKEEELPEATSFPFSSDADFLDSLRILDPSDEQEPPK